MGVMDYWRNKSPLPSKMMHLQPEVGDAGDYVVDGEEAEGGSHCK